MNDTDADPIVTVLPIHYSDALGDNVHIHQYPLLTRPLQVPPSAASAGKRIRARLKPNVKRLEVHVPLDTRQEVWNAERGKALGQARVDDDREKNQEGVQGKGKSREVEEPRLSEVRMRSEQIAQKGVYMLGVVRDGRLHLHPINETHQLRPTLTYLDVLNRKKRRGADDDSDSDDGPPPDPDEAPPPPVVKKEKRPVGEVKDVQVTAKKSDDKGGLNSLTGGLSQGRRDMLTAIHAEEDEKWEDMEFFNGDAEESIEAFEGVFSRNADRLETKFRLDAFLKDIKGL